jgi:hypothetical protein
MMSRHLFKLKLIALAAAVVVGSGIATPSDAAASVRWSDGGSSQVDIRCRTYGMQVANVELAHTVSGSGAFYYQYWVKDLYSGQWVGPSGFEPVGAFFLSFPVGARLQFYIRLWHQFPNGQWVSRDEYGYVWQNGVARGFGGTCQT